MRHALRRWGFAHLIVGYAHRPLQQRCQVRHGEAVVPLSDDKLNDGSRSGVEVEVYDYGTGEYRTFDMDE